MATRLRKTRRLRGGRHMGWGQVGQHRASGHKGGLGVTGFQKHHYSSLLKDEPDHYGHESTSPPHPNITRKWASVRDLDDLFTKFGKEEGGKKIVDLESAVSAAVSLSFLQIKISFLFFSQKQFSSQFKFLLKS